MHLTSTFHGDSFVQVGGIAVVVVVVATSIRASLPAHPRLFLVVPHPYSFPIDFASSGSAWMAEQRVPPSNHPLFPSGSR